MIPEEDRGPAWLRDYGFTDFSQIEADVTAMEQFATKLAADVANDYAPHLSKVADAMMTPLPAPPTEFVELSSFLIVHNDAQNATQQNTYNFANGTTEFANAARDISSRYQGSDAFAHAKVTDVDTAFSKVGIPTAPAEKGDL